jgi:glucan phosphoethanolaminetransferase (alkaline phosphatase superfamily)
MLRVIANILNYIVLMIGLLAFSGLITDLSSTSEELSVAILSVIFSLFIILSGVLNIIFIQSVKPLDPEKEALKKELETLRQVSEK